MKRDYSVYLCTERAYLKEQSLEEAVEQAILGGCTMVQLREKQLDTNAFYQEALRVKQVTDRYQVPLLINDRLDIALAVEADGVHLGQQDLPAARARALLGEDKIIGVTAKTVEQAKKAQADGADYLGVGAMYPSPTKSGAKGISFVQLRQIREAVTLPIVAIGGITPERIADFSGCEIQGVAVISAILAQPDPRKAAESIANKWKEIMKKERM